MMKHFFALAVFLTLTHQAVADVHNMMNDLVNLRSEVETMGHELEASRKELQNEIDLLLQKKAELESQLQREQLRRLQIDEKTKRLGQKVNVAYRQNPKAQTQLLAWIKNARLWVESSIPFRRPQRLQTLDDLTQRTQQGLENFSVLTANLWDFYEKEFKMASDIEYRVSELPLSETQQKAEIVRLGVFAMFARLANGKYVHYLKQNGDWQVTPLQKAYAAEIDRLIANLQDKRKSGLYSLPLVEENL